MPRVKMTAEQLREAKNKRNAEYRTKVKDAITDEERNAKIMEKERIKAEKEVERERIKLEREAEKEVERERIKLEKEEEEKRIKLEKKAEKKERTRLNKNKRNAEWYSKNKDKVVDYQREYRDKKKTRRRWNAMFIQNKLSSIVEYNLNFAFTKMKENLNASRRDYVKKSLRKWDISREVKWIDAEDDDGNDCKVKTVMLNGERLMCYESDEGWINYYTDENGDTFKKVIINLNTDDEEIINYIKPHNTQDWIRSETE